MSNRAVVFILCVYICLALQAPAPVQASMAVNGKNPAQAVGNRSVLNPAKIVKMAKTVRFIRKRVREQHPGIEGEALLEEICEVLGRLDIHTPPCDSLPSDVSNLELAASILSGRPPQRACPPTDDRELVTNVSRPIIIREIKPIQSPKPDRNRMFAGPVDIKHAEVNDNPGDGEVAKTPELHSTAAATADSNAKTTADDHDAGTFTGNTGLITGDTGSSPVLKPEDRTGLVHKVRRLLAFRRRAPLIQPGNELKRQVEASMNNLPPLSLTRGQQTRKAAKDPVLDAVLRLTREARRLLEIRPTFDKTQINKVVMASWRNLGLPCPELEKNWTSMAPEELARSISNRLSPDEFKQFEELSPIIEAL